MSGVQFGDGRQLDWRSELDESDPDDDQIQTPEEVVSILGFDPSETDTAPSEEA